MERYQNVEKVAVHDTDTCLFLAFDEVTDVTLISESHECRMGMLEQNENGHRMTATGFLMKLLNILCQSDPFSLCVSFSSQHLLIQLPQIFSQRNTCIDLIKNTKLIGIDSYLLPPINSWVCRDSSRWQGQSPILWRKCHHGEGKLQ